MSTPNPSGHRTTPPPTSPDRGGLAALSDVRLAPPRQALLEQAMATAQGSPHWKARKGAEARELLALEALAPPGRLLVRHLDAREALRAVISMDVPVGCRPDQAGPLVVERGAALGIRYPQEVLHRPLPGLSLVQVFAPLGVWHANVSSGIAQHLCLGATLPPGIRLKELVIMAYGALSMQSVMIDVRDPAGVLNPDAAEWWLENRDRLPLTSVPFLGSDPAEAQ